MNLVEMYKERNQESNINSHSSLISEIANSEGRLFEGANDYILNNGSRITTLNANTINQRPSSLNSMMTETISRQNNIESILDSRLEGFEDRMLQQMETMIRASINPIIMEQPNPIRELTPAQLSEALTTVRPLNEFTMEGPTTYVSALPGELQFRDHVYEIEFENGDVMLARDFMIREHNR